MIALIFIVVATVLHRKFGVDPLTIMTIVVIIYAAKIVDQLNFISSGLIHIGKEIEYAKRDAVGGVDPMRHEAAQDEVDSDTGPRAQSSD